jgi:hypothetical protein
MDESQAVEICTPRAAYELSVLTHFAKGSAAPRGRVSLPHDPRSGEERILVFADGNHAEAAKKLGVTYVGGEELIDSVCRSMHLASRGSSYPLTCHRCSPRRSSPRKLFVRRRSCQKSAS